MIKKILTSILVILMLCPYAAAAQTADDYVWECLLNETNDELISAGIMGYFERESGYKPDAIAYFFLYKDDVCAPFTEYLYTLELEEFITEIQSVGGYGLGQWYSDYHLKNFYYYFNNNGYEYDDIEAQCKFVVWSLKKLGIWNKLKETTKPYTIGLLIGHMYDGAQEGSHTIASISERIYKERS